MTETRDAARTPLVVTSRCAPRLSCAWSAQVSKADDSIGPEVAEKAKAMGNGEVRAGLAMRHPCELELLGTCACVSSIHQGFICFELLSDGMSESPSCHRA